MRPAANLAGLVFGRLTVLRRSGSTAVAPRRPLWRCLCSCGTEVVVLAASLRNKRTSSCGCLRAELARVAIGSAAADRLRNLRALGALNRATRPEVTP